MIDVIATPFTIGDIVLYKEAGASSVVISTPFFSARGAALFPIEQLSELHQECQRHEMKMLVKVNRFFTEEELPLLKEHLKLLKELDVDGIYYGDEGVLYEAIKLEMQHKLIYFPDTLITNHLDASYYLSQGISMVSISREITLDEICEIASQLPDQIEVMIHGRVNMMHSKRMLVSNYLDFIGKEHNSKDKKTLYIMEETREEHMPILEDALGTHVFSGYTLASFHEIKHLIQRGVRHVFIDGIFHDSAYVCEAIRAYTAVIHGADVQQIEAAFVKDKEADHMTSGFYYTKTSKVKVGE